MFGGRSVSSHFNSAVPALWSSLDKTPLHPPRPFPGTPPFSSYGLQGRKKKRKSALTHTHMHPCRHIHTHTLAHKAASSPHPVGWFFFFFLKFLGENYVRQSKSVKLETNTKEMAPCLKGSNSSAALAWALIWTGVARSTGLLFKHGSIPMLHLASGKTRALGETDPSYSKAANHHAWRQQPARCCNFMELLIVCSAMPIAQTLKNNSKTCNPAELN